MTCGNPCTLVNMNIHDNPNSFAGFWARTGAVTITGGRVSNNGSLGIGGSQADPMIISGVEIDHNGTSANCGFEGGGFKGVNRDLHFFNNYVHDNNCPGVWLDISAGRTGGSVEIDHNRVVNNSHEGIMYEISYNGSIHDNAISGNGYQTNGVNTCSWLWGAGIGVYSAGEVNAFNNTLANNCNELAGTQQNRGIDSSTGLPYLLHNDSFYNNTVSGGGRSGVVEDNGADLTIRNIVFANNAFTRSATFCGYSC